MLMKNRYILTIVKQVKRLLFAWFWDEKGEEKAGKSGGKVPVLSCLFTFWPFLGHTEPLFCCLQNGRKSVNNRKQMQILEVNNHWKASHFRGVCKANSRSLQGANYEFPSRKLKERK